MVLLIRMRMKVRTMRTVAMNVENMLSLMRIKVNLVMKVLRRTREIIGRIMLKMVDSHSM